MSLSFWAIFILILALGIPSLWLHLLTRNKKYSILTKGKKYVGFWLRFGAGLTDVVILLVIEYILAKILFGSFLLDDSGIVLIDCLISWSYVCIMQSSSRQATLGMMLFKFKICDHSLKRVGLGKITLRYFSTSLSILILGIGFFMIGWTKKKQGLHDLFAKTLHVETQ
tara:strand:- start:490 stop:996 length:507 start_codon:yes stop_codon:yes gene_type:complete